MAATSSASTRSAADGRVAAEPLQVIPVGRNAHSIRVDESNKFAYVPTLGSDEMFQFSFRCEVRPAQLEHARGLPDEADDGPAPFRHLRRQQVPVRAERTARDGHDFRAGRQDRAADRSEFGIRAAARYQARARRAARRSRRAECAAAAQHRQRHLGRGHPPDPERQVPLHLGAHQQHPGGVQRGWRKRQAQLICRARPPSASRADSRSIPRAGSWSRPGKNRKPFRSIAIDQASGALKFLSKYPAGKGANWVEIVSFD